MMSFKLFLFFMSGILARVGNLVFQDLNETVEAHREDRADSRTEP